jgi:hypothetical protein
VLAGVERIGIVGPVGSLVDPGAKNADLLGGEAFALGRHEGAIASADEVDEGAVGAFAGDDGSPGVAAAEGVGLAVEAEAGALLLGAVAGKASLLEDRPHVAVKVHPGGGFRTVGMGQAQQGDGEQEGGPGEIQAGEHGRVPEAGLRSSRYSTRSTLQQESCLLHYFADDHTPLR